MTPPFALMAGEILEKQQKINILSQFVRKGLKEGLSATKMYEQIRGTPLGIRKKDFLGLVREIREVQHKAENTIKYTRTEYLFPKGVEVVDWNMKRPFLYRFSVQFEGEIKPRIFSTYYDAPVTGTVALREKILDLEEIPREYEEEIGVAGKRILSVEMLPTAVSREFSPGWLRRRFGF